MQTCPRQLSPVPLWYLSVYANVPPSTVTCTSVVPSCFCKLIYTQPPPPPPPPATPTQLPPVPLWYLRVFANIPRPPQLSPVPPWCFSVFANVPPPTVTRTSVVPQCVVNVPPSTVTGTSVVPQCVANVPCQLSPVRLWYLRVRPQLPSVPLWYLDVFANVPPTRTVTRNVPPTNCHPYLRGTSVCLQMYPAAPTPHGSSVSFHCTVTLTPHTPHPPVPSTCEFANAAAIITCKPV